MFLYNVFNSLGILMVPPVTGTACVQILCMWVCMFISCIGRTILILKVTSTLVKQLCYKLLLLEHPDLDCSYSITNVSWKPHPWNGDQSQSI